MSYESIKAKNKHLVFLNEDSAELARYGRFISIPGIQKLIAKADKSITINQEQNTYVASEPSLDTEENRKLFASYFGGMDIQIGWVAGPNSTMNGMEYHKSNEILVALTEQVLLLGLQTDMDKNYLFQTNIAKALYLANGECFELLPQTLHLSPCKTSDTGFKTLIILPQGTNLPLDNMDSENTKMLVDTNEGATTEISQSAVKEAHLLFMKNKWLLAHPDRKPLIEKGAFPGLVGENIRVWY